MKKERLVILQELMVTQINHWSLFPLVVTFFGIVNLPLPTLWSWLLCSLVMFVQFIIRRYTRNFFVFLFGHLLILGVLAVLPGSTSFEKLFLEIYGIGYVVYSFYLRLKTEDRLDERIHPALTVVITALLLALQNSQGQQGLELYYVIPVVYCLVLHFFRLYLNQYQFFLVVNESSAGQIPEKEMFRCGIGFVAIFAGSVAVILSLVSNVSWLAPIFSYLKVILLRLIRLLFRGGGKEEVPIEEAVTPSKSPNGGGLPRIEGETALIWVILEDILMTAGYILAVCAAIYCVYKLVTYLYRKFQDKAFVNEVAIDSVNDRRERCEIERTKKEKKGFSLFLSPNDRIRRIYKKEVWSNRLKLTKNGRPEQLGRMTAAECGTALERGNMTISYEKARYSDAECTTEDVKRAKIK